MTLFLPGRTILLVPTQLSKGYSSSVVELGLGY